MDDSTNVERSLDRSTRGSECEPDIDLYAAEDIADARSKGFRVYQSDDAVFEARTAEDAASRVFPEDGDWRSTVQIPVDGVQDAYTVFRDVGERLEEAYDADCSMDFLTFQQAYEDGDISRDGGLPGLRYNHEDGNTLPRKRLHTYGTEGTGMGLVGGWLGGMGAGLGAEAVGIVPPEGGFPIALGTAGGLTLLGWGAGYAKPKAHEKWVNWRQDRKYGDVEALNASLLEQLNERNSLERLLRRDEPFPDHIIERYNDLADAEPEDAFDLLVDTHFERFPAAQGVTATGTFDAYEEAVRFQDVVRGEDEGAVERPSLYTNPDAFRTMFDHCTPVVNGEEHVLKDAEVLVRNVYKRDDVDTDIMEWLEDAYPGLIQAVGQEHALEGDAG